MVLSYYPCPYPSFHTTSGSRRSLPLRSCRATRSTRSDILRTGSSSEPQASALSSPSCSSAEPCSPSRSYSRMSPCLSPCPHTSPTSPWRPLRSCSTRMSLRQMESMLPMPSRSPSLSNRLDPARSTLSPASDTRRTSQLLFPRIGFHPSHLPLSYMSLLMLRFLP